MESLERTKSFFVTLRSIFTPKKVTLTTSNNTIISFNTMTPKGTIQLSRFLRSTSSRLYVHDSNSITISEVKIITQPGTIREHSNSYGRKARKTLNYMNMDIDLLHKIPTPVEKDQEVILSAKGLSRNGTNITPIPLENLRKIWNEISTSQGPKMPHTFTAHLL